MSEHVPPDTHSWTFEHALPTGGCLACLLPSCSEQHQDFCHVLQPRGFLFQQTWGWVKNLWNTIYLGGWRIFVYQQFWCEGYQGFDPQRRPTLPSVSVTTTGQIRSLLVDIEQGHGGLTRQVDAIFCMARFRLCGRRNRCQTWTTFRCIDLLYSYIMQINSWRWVYNGVHVVTASINHRHAACNASNWSQVRYSAEVSDQGAAWIPLGVDKSQCQFWIPKFWLVDLEGL